MATLHDPAGEQNAKAGTAELSPDQKRSPSSGCLAGCWAGCWPRRSGQQGEALASASTAAPGAGQAATEECEVVLHVGFAIARLQRLEDRAASSSNAEATLPSHAFHIEALSDTNKVGEEAIDSLLDFMDHVLRLPDVSRGFVIVYDLRRLGYAQRDLISQISSWSCNPHRQALWSKLCRSWYVLYPSDVEDDDVSVQVAKTWLWMLFFSHPPGACPAYLIADPALIGKQLDEDHICFMPVQDAEDNTGHEVAKSVVGLSTAVIGQTTSAANAVIGTAVTGVGTAVTGVASAAGAVVGVVRGSGGPADQVASDNSSAAEAAGSSAETTGSAAAAVGPSDSAAASSAAPATRAAAKAESRSKTLTPKEVAEKFPLPLPEVINVSCAHIHQGVDHKTGLGYLKVIGTGGEITDEGISRMMEFYDAFLYSPHAVNGFSITYDLRNLRSPSMSMILRVAEWGNEPTRQAMWQTLNVECRVCVSSGMRYTISKAALSAFFYVCPPVCRTYLLTGPDENLEDAVVFLPSSPAETAPEDTPKRSPEDLQAAFKQKINSEITDEVGKMKGDDEKRWSFEQEVMRVYEEIMYGDMRTPVTPAAEDPHAWVFTTQSW